MRRLFWMTAILTLPVQAGERWVHPTLIDAESPEDLKQPPAKTVPASTRMAVSQPSPEASPSEIQPHWPEGLPPFVQAGLRESNQRQKPLLLDFYTDWCGPCKLMKHKTFPDPRVRRELENWVVLRIDRDLYPRLAAAFSVSGLPTYLLLSEKGTVLGKVLGYQLAEDFAIWLADTREKNPF